MNDLAKSGPDREAAAGARLRSPNCIVFVLAGKRFAVSLGAVEAVARPPLLARVPHAGPALLGVGNLGGRVAPVLDLACLLGLTRGAATYEGGGEILRLGGAGGNVGVWVDRVEGLVHIDEQEGAAGIDVLDPEPLFAVALTPPSIALEQRAPLADLCGPASCAAGRRWPQPAFS